MKGLASKSIICGKPPSQWLSAIMRTIPVVCLCVSGECVVSFHAANVVFSLSWWSSTQVTAPPGNYAEMPLLQRACKAITRLQLATTPLRPTYLWV